MKTMILGLGLMAILFSSIQSRATFLVDDTEIVRQLCPKDLCMNRWNNVTIMMCNNTTGHEPAGKDYVYGSYIIGQRSCLCPCNFIKFYK